MFKFLKLVLGNEGGYIGKEKKAQWAQAKAASDQQAAVLREQIASNERITADTNKAMERASRDGAISGVIAGAMAANTTTETIKQLLPHERGAAMMMSYDLAEKWNTTREMKESGYSGVAIEYALNNKSHKALYGDPAYATALMKEQQKKDMVTNIQTFGIKSASNPYGADISADQWVAMHSTKDAKSMLEVDPVVARERQAAMDKWESQMRAEGKGVLVDLYKNPQLSGHGLQAMKGKDPLIPKDVMPLIASVAGDGKPGAGGGTDWSEAIKAMGRGEQNPHTKEVEWAMKEGIVDKYGMVATDKLMSFIPPELQNAPSYDPMRQLTDQEKAKLMDDYSKFSQITVDPKNVREEQIGMGKTKKYKLNADGTVAGTVMEGYMTSPTGEQIFMSMPGASLQDWTTKETQMLSGLGPTFPGQLALSTESERNGRMGGDYWRKNMTAAPNQGMAGPQMTSPKTPAGAPAPAAAAPSMVSSFSPSPGAGTAGKPANVNQGSTQPAGYAGAPLAAGEE